MWVFKLLFFTEKKTPVFLPNWRLAVHIFHYCLRDLSPEVKCHPTLSLGVPPGDLRGATQVSCLMHQCIVILHSLNVALVWYSAKHSVTANTKANLPAWPSPGHLVFVRSWPPGQTGIRCQLNLKGEVSKCQHRSWHQLLLYEVIHLLCSDPHYTFMWLTFCLPPFRSFWIRAEWSGACWNFDTIKPDPEKFWL